MMNIRRRDADATGARGKTPRWLEMAVFFLASGIGVYGIGKGLTGFYEQGQQINLLWLAVTGIAFFVLFAQMGRVHDSWPHRPKQASPQAPGAPAVATQAAPLDESSITPKESR